MKRTIFSKVIAAIVIVYLITSIVVFDGSINAVTLSSPKNVILLIGDGMGFNHIAAARDSKGAPLAMDSIAIKGSVSTSNAEGGVTDSAAAATAMACGVKTSNAVIGMDTKLKAIPNLSEFFKSYNKKIGLITTVNIGDATPAAFASHAENRDEETSIVQQYINNNIDVLMGGGKADFTDNPTKASNGTASTLYKVATAERGYTAVGTRNELLDTKSIKLLGLFADGDMPYEIGRDKISTPSLTEMTEKSIEILNQNPNGFFLMVEGGLIDHAAQYNSLTNVVDETLAFDSAVKTALDFAATDGNTLVIVTADHETGGLSKDITTGQYVFSTVAHTSANVPLFAYGVGAGAFTGDIVNTDINKLIKQLMPVQASPSLAIATASPFPAISPSSFETNTAAPTSTIPSETATSTEATISPMPTISPAPHISAPLIGLFALFVCAGIAGFVLIKRKAIVK